MGIKGSQAGCLSARRRRDCGVTLHREVTETEQSPHYGEADEALTLINTSGPSIGQGGT